MTALLVALTFGALALSGALVFYILRLTRQERNRSAARAAALSEAIGGASPVTTGDAPGIRAAVDPWLARERPVLTGPSFSTLDGDAAPRPAALLVPAAALLVAGLAAGAFYALGGGAPRGTGEAAAPLELLSLAHDRQGDTVTVSGVVRNPLAGPPVSGVTAVALVFDRQGTFLTTGRAALDYPRLAPGDESPFSVVIPSTAGRYRVSFRAGDRVLSHVDRREPAVGPLPARSEVSR